MSLRESRAITWAEQRRLLPHLADHLAKMALFDLNTRARDDVVCGLKWEWEIFIPELGRSVFDMPKENVRGRKRSRVLVCNSVAQSIVEGQRGKHPVYVFTYKGNRIETVSNNGWQRARRPDYRTCTFTICGTRWGCGCGKLGLGKRRLRTFFGTPAEA